MAKQQTYESGGFRFDMFTGAEQDLAPNAVLISGESDAVLVDAGFVKHDVDQLLEMVKQNNRKLRAIFITHAHPDHYCGIMAFREAFPGVPILARQGVIDGILEWPAKRVHWQDLFEGRIPVEIIPPDPLVGKNMPLEHGEIVFIDLPVCETVHATAFYVPQARAIITGDAVFNRYHCYMSDTNNPDSWISAIEVMRKVGPIDLVFPGHGAVGGTELFDANIRWLEDWREVAKPGVHFTTSAKEMMQRYPDYGLPLLLWLTRGPGFGLFGAKEAGVPPEVLGG